MTVKSILKAATSPMAIAAAGAALATLLISSPAQALDIPTGAPPSPLFGAQPFTQKVVLFEEFGTKQMPTTEAAVSPLPPPDSCAGAPNGAALDTFLAQPLSPLPTAQANTSKPNMWSKSVETCYPELYGQMANSPVEGRPPGEWFAHQRWAEFKPQVYFQTAMAGARVNGGLRDKMQMHGYRYGEFAPGGLYYNTTGLGSQFNGTTKGIPIRMHPNFPIQDRNSVWTFDGTLPPKLLMARYGVPILFRHFNALPIDEAANNGFGMHTITTHEHNGHNPAESDGFAGAYFYPGQFYDYRWPMQLAGRDTINTDASDPRAGAPDGAGGIMKVRGDYRETMSTHWFHDHMLDFTAQNVYKGNAAMMNYYSSIDRGREGFNCNYTNAANPNLCFPSGTALDWGNRDYDVNLVIADKAWDANGQLYFNKFNTDGFLGDQVTVNWLWKPYMEVRARRYRFRILDGSVSRYFKLALVDETGKRVPYYMIANDGNIMEHAVPFPNAESADLPTQGIAERYDIVVDFRGYTGKKLYFVNLLEHQDGKGPNKPIPLADVLSGAYVGDPAVGKFMEFRVVSYSGVDRSMNPADYVEGKKAMVLRNPMPQPGTPEYQNAVHRTFEFGRTGGSDGAPWTIKTDGGAGLNADISLVSAAPTIGAVEIWHIKNGGNGWAHPVHVHFEEGHILMRDGKAPPIWERGARKDVYRVGSDSAGSSTEVTMGIRIREFAGTFVEHCHNTQHEDHAMLLRWDSQKPGQTLAIPTPDNGWTGTTYLQTSLLPTAVTGSAPQ
ncbi:MAG: multicopper oxidase domain-containing protein [Alphaproteobacteria bacterium]|nr:multicopper oxidase domain-containing protein [Alphaproteobacteria bacterium]